MRWIGLFAITLLLAPAAVGAEVSLVGLGWDAVKGFGVLVGQAVVSFVLWSVLGLILGAVAGVFLWRWLRGRGWLDVDWGWYKYFRWIWPVLIVGCLSLGMSCSVGTWGAGRKVKVGMREGKVVETAVVNTYSMVMVWRLKGANAADANGSEALLDRDLAAGLDRLKSASGVADGVEDGARELILKKIDEQSGGSAMERWVYRKLVEAVWESQLNADLPNDELVEVVRSTLDSNNTNAESTVVKAARSKIIAGVHVVVDDTITGLVWSTILTVLTAVLGVLGVPLGIFWLVRWLWLRKHPPDEPDDGEPPVLDTAN